MKSTKKYYSLRFDLEIDSVKVKSIIAAARKVYAERGGDFAPTEDDEVLQPIPPNKAIPDLLAALMELGEQRYFAVDGIEDVIHSSAGKRPTPAFCKAVRGVTVQ